MENQDKTESTNQDLTLEKYKIDKKFEISQNMAEKKLEMSSLVKVGDVDLATISLLADKFARAGDLVPKEYQANPEKCFAAIYKGATLGLDAFTALAQIAVVNQRATIWGDTALALVRQSGLMSKFKEEITTRDGKLLATCTVQRKGEEENIEEYSQSDAEKAGLWDERVKIKAKAGYEMANPSPWFKHPKRMLKYRARAFALRDIFPDVLQGLHLKEEMEGEDFKEVAPSAPVETVETETIETDQGIELQELIKKAGKTDQEVCDIYGINSIVDLPLNKFETLKKSLNENS